jgi:hypothetical protein
MSPAAFDQLRLLRSTPKSVELQFVAMLREHLLEPCERRRLHL